MGFSITGSNIVFFNGVVCRHGLEELHSHRYRINKNKPKYRGYDKHCHEPKNYINIIHFYLPY
jgi:hypothetical protein